MIILKSKLNKDKVCLLVFSCISILILIYPCFIQRWTGAVDVNLSDVEKLNCFDNENSENIIKSVFDKLDGDKILPEPGYYKKADECNGFLREITVDKNFTSMRIDYTFTDSAYSNVKIYVAAKEDYATVKDDYSFLKQDDFYWFALQSHEYDSVETLKSALSDEIGKNRFIYDRFAKQGTIANVNYYISPLTTNSRKTYFYMFPNKRLERTVYSVFEVGNYSISIHETISFDNESKYNIALNDFTNLLYNTVDS